MTDSPLTMFLMALIAFCAVLTAVSLLITASSLWRTTSRLDRLLAHGDDAVQEARLALGSVHALFSRTHRAADFLKNLFGRLHRVRRGVHRFPNHVTNKRRMG